MTENDHKESQLNHNKGILKYVFALGAIISDITDVVTIVVNIVDIVATLTPIMAQVVTSVI